MSDSCLHAIYDLRVSSPGFDFLSFLMMADSHRENKGLHYLIVSIVKPNDELECWNEHYQSDSLATLPEQFLNKRYENILLKCCEFYPKIKEVNTLFSHELKVKLESKSSQIFPFDYMIEKPRSSYAFLDLFKMVKKGVIPSSITVPEYNLQYVLAKYGDFSKTITITLRNSPHDIVRNSQLDEWRRFAEKRVEEGYRVLWLDDVDAESKAKLPKGGVEVFEFNILTKAAIYQYSKINFFVNNGTAMLSYYNHFSHTVIAAVKNEASSVANTQFFHQFNLKIGCQFPYTSPLHYNYWKEDSYCNLKEFWKSKGILRLERFSSNKAQLISRWTDDIASNQGISQINYVQELDRSLPIYIWGINGISATIARNLIRDGYEVECFIDSFKYSTNYKDKPVKHPFDLKSLTRGNLIIAAFSENGECRTKLITQIIDDMIVENHRVITQDYLSHEYFL